MVIEKGYYARKNLEIEIVRSQGSANTIKQVGNGTAKVGFAELFILQVSISDTRIPQCSAAPRKNVNQN